jgi:hypothetical protein
MNITREVLEQHSACAPGLKDFVETFPSGGEYNEVLLAARQVDAHKMDGLMREAYVRLMGRSMGVTLNYTPTQKFRVFNQLTNTHEQLDSLEAAKLVRKQSMEAYLQQNIDLFTVAQETTNPNGDSLWLPLTSEELHDFGVTFKHTTAQLFHVFNPLTGTHEKADSIEAAKQLREQIMQTYLEQNSSIFTVSQESQSSTGDILWVQLSLDELNK